MMEGLPEDLQSGVDKLSSLVNDNQLIITLHGQTFQCFSIELPFGVSVTEDEEPVVCLFF